MEREDILEKVYRSIDMIVEAGENLEDLMIMVRADVTSKDPRRVKRYYGNFDRVMDRIEAVVDRLVADRVAIRPRTGIARARTNPARALLDAAAEKPVVRARRPVDIAYARAASNSVADIHLALGCP